MGTPGGVASGGGAEGGGGGVVWEDSSALSTLEFWGWADWGRESQRLLDLLGDARADVGLWG